MFVCSAPTAQASFDPPDETVINANLPASVPLGYHLDLDALCGAGASATVTAWVRDPAGGVRKVNTSSGSGSAFEATFGVELKAFGGYRRWLDVTCGSAAAQRIEEGGFTVSGDARRAKKCTDSQAGAKKARKKLKRARAALERKDTDTRRKAVRRAKKNVRTVKKRVAKYCTPV